MDALMAALVAALLAQAGDRQGWVAARLARQFDRPAIVLIMATIAMAIGYGLGGFAGGLMAPILTPNARALLLAVALVSSGASALWPPRPLPQCGGATLGVAATALITLLAASMGDRTQFIVAALAARSDAPLFAAIGGTLGSVAAFGAMMAYGEPRRGGPVAAIRIGSGVILIIAGAIAGLSALRLI